MRADQLIVQVRDKTLKRKGTIRPRDLNLAAVVRYCDVGEWSITLPKVHPMVAVLQEPGSGIVVSYNASTAFAIPAETLFSGPTEKPGRLTDRANPDGTYTFKGLTDDVILRDTRAFPQPSNPDPSTQNVANDTRTGVAETVMRAYVSANIGPTAHASRRGLLAQTLTLATDLGRGPSVTRSPRFENLLSLLRGIALYAGLGFRVVQSGSSLVFEVRSIVDRTAEVRLDIASGTLASEQVETAPPTVTRAIVAGQGEGTARTIVQRTSADSTAAETAWGRIIEEWMDARGSALLAEVQQKGDEAILAGGATTTAVKLTPSDDQTMLFMRDWEVGDRIAVILPSSAGPAPFTPVVTAAAIVAGAGRAALGMSIGDTSQMSDKAATVSKVSSTTQRVEDLEQSEPTWAKLGGIPSALTTDPNADRFLFWDDSAGALAFLAPTSALVITGTSLDVAQATDILAGKVELATSAVTITGTDATRAVTPAGLAARTALDTRAGIVELATSAEAITGTDTARAVTPAAARAAQLALIPVRFRLEWKGVAFTGGANMGSYTTIDDPYSGWDNTNKRWTVPAGAGGVYLFAFRWKSNASGGAVNAVLLKGTSSPVEVRRSDNGPSGAYSGGQLADYIVLAAGDVLQMRFTANLTTQSDTPAENTWWSLLRLGAS